MSRLEQVLKAYRAGMVPRHWAELEFAVLIAPENIDNVMSQLPAEIVEGLSQWNLEDPGLILGSGMAEAERQRLSSQLLVALPALRTWFAKHNGPTSPDPGASTKVRQFTGRLGQGKEEKPSAPKG
jgi:hypothetical protein